MNTPTEQLIRTHWELSNQRRWDAFSTLLHPQLRYDCPQTREYIDGALGYVELFRTWPGEWHATVQKVIAAGNEGMSIIEFSVGEETMTGLSVFEATDGRISRVTDYWPANYEPPPRATPHMRRHDVSIKT